MRIEQVRAIHADVDHHNLGAGEAVGRLEHIRRSSVDHSGKVREGRRGYELFVFNGRPVRESHAFGHWIDADRLMAQADIGLLHEAPQITYETTLGWIPEFGDVVHVVQSLILSAPARTSSSCGRYSRGPIQSVVRLRASVVWYLRV